MFDFAGRTALITGAASGIGRATAAYFLGCGAQVVLGDIDAAGLAQTRDAADPEGARTLCRPFDAADPASIAALVEAAVQRFGGIDHLVCGHGIYVHQRIAAMEAEAWRRMMAVNLDGVFHLIRAAIAAVRDGGAIVVIGSVAGHQGGSYGNAHYGASKGAVIALARGLARELGPRRIRVNAVAPGLIDTPMIARTLAELGDRQAQGVPLGRVGRPEEVASVIAFLCSEAASYVSGESVLVTGGGYMG